MVECSVPGCTNEARVIRRALCSKHYQRWVKWGDPTVTMRPGLGLSDLERFWSKVNKDGDGGCWLWTGSIRDTGYGQFALGGKNLYAHIHSYRLTKGEIPDGLELDHLCRVRSCMNPSHLEPVTHAENVKRGALPSVNRARGELITHCIHGHEFTPENTIKRKAGGRQCRACMNRQQREYQARRRLRAS